MRLLFLGLVALPSISQAYESSPLLTTPFIFLSLLGPHTGGFPALSRTFYIGQDGYLQVSEESSDGILRRLRQGLIDTTTFYEARRQADAARKPDDAQESTLAHNELTDYFPPKVVLVYTTASGGYFARSYERARLPKPVYSLMRQVIALQDRPEFTDADPGIYVRAQRLEKFDPRIQTLDLVVDMEEAAHSVDFSNAIGREMAFTPVDLKDGVARFFGRVPLRREDPLHMQIGAMVYRILVYQTQP